MDEITNFSETNGYIFNIEDLEITFLVDSGTKKIFHNNAEADDLPRHFHPYYELFFIESGELSALIKDREEKLLKNDIMIISPGTPHATERKNEDTRRYNFAFSFRKNGIKSANSFYDKIKPLLKPPYGIMRNCGDIRETIKNIHSCILKRDGTLLGLYLYELMIKFISYNLDRKGDYDERPLKYDTDMMRLHKIAHLVNNKQKDFVSLKYIASALQLSVRQTDRIIKRYYGVPYGELVLSRKMAYAAELVLNTKMTVSKISQELGYSSTKGFYYAFRKKYGCLPSEYRKQMKKQ